MKGNYLDHISFLKDEFPELVAKSNDITKHGDRIMSNFNKTLQALSVIQSELDVLKYELSPSDWAVLSFRVDELNACLCELQEEYLKDE